MTENYSQNNEHMEKDTEEQEIDGEFFECPDCGEPCPEDAEECEFCGAPLFEYEVEEEEGEEQTEDGKTDGTSPEPRIIGIRKVPGKPPTPILAEETEDTSKVSFKENVWKGKDPMVTGKVKVPLEQAANLIALKNALNKIKENEITLEEYQTAVAEVYTVAALGVELFKRDLVASTIKELPPEQQKLANETAQLFADYAKGCEMMLEFDGVEKLEQAEEGLKKVEETLRRMDEIQDQALSIYRQETATPDGLVDDDDDDDDDYDDYEDEEEEEMRSSGQVVQNPPQDPEN